MGSQTTSGAQNDFISIFGSIFDTALESAKKIGTDVLPVWAANQLDLERKDGLYQPINDARFRPPTVESFGRQSGGFQAVGGITGNKTADIAIIGGLLALGVFIVVKS